MPATPKRRQILEALRDRLLAISTADGFATDAGQLVFLNETPALGPDDPTVAIAMLVGEDTVKFQGDRFLIDLPVDIQALAKADLDQPWVAVESVLGDIKRAMELEDRTLGRLVQQQLERGTTRTMEREPGSAYVGVEIRYTAPYREEWGEP